MTVVSSGVAEVRTEDVVIQQEDKGVDRAQGRPPSKGLMEKNTQIWQIPYF